MLLLLVLSLADASSVPLLGASEHEVRAGAGQDALQQVGDGGGVAHGRRRGGGEREACVASEQQPAQQQRRRHRRHHPSAVPQVSVDQGLFDLSTTYVYSYVHSYVYSYV